MFTAVAFSIVLILGWLATRGNEKDRDQYDRQPDHELRLLVLHIRQDLKLLVFGISGVIIMLGIVADRIP